MIHEKVENIHLAESKNHTAEVSDGTNSSRSYGPEHYPFMLSREDLPFCNNIPARLNLKLLYTRYFNRTTFREMGKNDNESIGDQNEH